MRTNVQSDDQIKERIAPRLRMNWPRWRRKVLYTKKKK